jgi:Fe-S-cluster containining protein
MQRRQRRRTDDPMSDDSTPTRTMRTATVDLKVARSRLQFKLTVPDGPTRKSELLPLFRSLTDTVVEAAVDAAQAGGYTVSCRKGCGACCRQVVPISDVEAESIRALVDALPEPRRTAIVERFERARDVLADAGLLETLRASRRVPAGDAEALGIAYFRLGIACPFLEDEACSIHAERPLACREYLVTTPAANCAQPTRDTIHCVPVPARVSRAIRRIDEDVPPGEEPWLPLVLALEWPLPDDPARRSGTSMIARALAFLTGQDVAEPDPQQDPPVTA